MCSHRLVPDSLGKMPRQPFCQAAGINKNQGGPVLFNQVFKAIVNFLPDFVGHYRLTRAMKE